MFNRRSTGTENSPFLLTGIIATAFPCDNAKDFYEKKNRSQIQSSIRIVLRLEEEAEEISTEGRRKHASYSWSSGQRAESSSNALSPISHSILFHQVGETDFYSRISLLVTKVVKFVILGIMFEDVRTSMLKNTK